MFKITTLNKISKVGLDTFTDNYELIQDIESANGILVRSQNMKDMEFSQNLKAIARAGAGTNNIPVTECGNKGIVVFNTPGANANSVKELVISAMLLSSRNISPAISWAQTLETNVAKEVEKGKSQFAGNEILGKTLGIIGLGAIGVLLGNAARGLGMNVIGFDPFLSLKSAHGLDPKIEVVENLDAMLGRCDFISLHIPANENTKGLLDKEKLSKMKKGSVLLNFSRDTLVNENDLLEILTEGHLKQYVSDFPNDNLVGQDNVLLLPHLGASTKEAEDNCATMAAVELMDFLENGNIRNSVNFPNCSLGNLSPVANGRLVVLFKACSSMLGDITNSLHELEIQIENIVSSTKGDFGCALIDVKGEISSGIMEKAFDFDNIIDVQIR